MNHPASSTPATIRTTVILLLGACSLATATAATGKWMSLFDGKSLAGWQPNESPGSWVIEDGAIVTKGTRSHLFYVGDVANHNFKNFEFSATVMTTPGSNSGIYIHTHLAPDPWPQAGYECQVINSSRAIVGEYSENKMTGSIYAVRNTWRAPAKDNAWFEYRIKVSGKTIQTFIDGKLICQYTEGPNAWRAKDKPGRYLTSGTFALQAHDPKSEVHYRNLKVRLLPDDAPSLDEPMADHDLDTLITQFSDQNYALIDLGIEAGSTSVMKAQADAARKLGVTFGYAYAPELMMLSRIGAGAPVVVINDKDAPPSVAVLKAAKASGAKIAFSSGGVSSLDPARLKKRLEAMREAELAWQDIWVPGKVWVPKPPAP